MDANTAILTLRCPLADAPWENRRDELWSRGSSIETLIGTRAHVRHPRVPQNERSVAPLLL